MSISVALCLALAIALAFGFEEDQPGLLELLSGDRVKREGPRHAYRPFYPDERSRKHEVGYYFEPLGVDHTDPQPQFVIMTFDDAITRHLYTNVYQPMLDRRDAQTSCPIHATFFASHTFTDYAAAQSLDSWGHEIALHSFTHGYDSKMGEENVRTNFTARRWSQEVQSNVEMAMTFADLTGPFGFRAPFLHTGGNALFDILADNKFTMYDSSLTFPQSRKTWPYHLGNPSRQYSSNCLIKPCPTGHFNLWEVPLGLWKDINNADCQMMDACNMGSTVDEAFSVMMKNFNEYRKDNIPFPMMMHAALFLDWELEFVKIAFERFIDTLLAEDHVHFVTVKDLINYIENPLPTGKMYTRFRDSLCRARSYAKHLGHDKCERIALCVYGDVAISTCQRCPASLPTV